MRATAATAASNLWTVARRASRARLRLFCFPYAGGGAAAFRSWPPHLSPDLELLLLQMPGKESRLLDPPFTRMAELVAAATDELLPRLEGPFAFFGHSMGARVSLEVARELRRRGAPLPARLLISGARAPQIPDPDPPIHHLPDAEFLEEIRQRYDSIPEEVLGNPELLELVLPGLRADFELFETYGYAPEAPLGSPISAFGGEEDSRASREQIAAWADQTTGPFRLRMFPGAHFFIQTAQGPFLRALVEELSSLLERSSESRAAE